MILYAYVVEGLVIPMSIGRDSWARSLEGFQQSIDINGCHSINTRSEEFTIQVV
jgi:hypothetical protein